ncbi:flavin reductase family protein [Selenihalanaerobacter shriftii]|uniref:Flavin reductase like domain-containing protein n=1 Tax=Selenihalanaerobacter shriftii TaxID=142842 RepID=A0A1T4K1A8_9FIRM|nr:flavin reductase [Selenihalanaerobacter shriftii]SJZ36168.1 Flavin reductase like domain-containing protein [Selenihalanaerobacter shriftii]
MKLELNDFQNLLPVPLTVITTIDTDEIPNAAPYGCVMSVLKSLDIIALASAIPRDTLQNIRETREFVINVMGEPSLQKTMQCAKDYASEVNELEETDLSTIRSNLVKPLKERESD